MKIVWKKRGRTMGELTELVRKKLGIEKTTYAGILDPVAEGLCLFLEGEELADKEKYCGWDKAYEFSVVLGFETDTWDLFGVVKNIDRDLFFGLSDDAIRFLEGLCVGDIVEDFKGEFEWEYPVFSSKKVDGVASWKLGASGARFERGAGSMSIFDLRFVGGEIVGLSEVCDIVRGDIESVRGDFRFAKISESYNEIGCKGCTDEAYLPVLKFYCRVSAGTYVRSIAENLCRALGVAGCVLRLIRVGLGEYSRADAVHIE